MAKVKNSSYVNIKRVTGTTTDTLGNQIFNGYVYNLSLTVGFNGEPSSLILNLALNKTLKNVSKRDDIVTQRKQDIQTANGTVTSQGNVAGNTGNSGNVGSSRVLADNDFDINEKHIGINTSYNIVIQSIPDSGVAAENYELFNFKITSYSISKKNNEKILTLTLSDNSIVLNKIFVGLLGQHVALDSRSEKTATINDIKIFCPAVNLQKEGMKVSNFEQLLHFTEEQLAKKLEINTGTSSIKSGVSDSSGKFNYIIIESKDSKKSIRNGYGAVILLGEEEFKDSQCASSEVTYSFETLLAAMKRLGIKIASISGPSPSLKDKSLGKVKKNFSGTLKDVLNQWCDEYSYSYVVDFSIQSEIVIKGIDLSSGTPKETVMLTKLNLENLETTTNSNFVIQSQDFDYDLSQKKLNLYSSFYFKESRDSSNSFEQSFGNKDFGSMNLKTIFPQWFGIANSTIGARFAQLDFCGAARTYKQVITSAVLGKFSPKLRQIYNYRIRAFRALGFLTVTDENLNSKLNLGNDPRLLLEEAVSAILEIQSKNLFDAEGDALYNFNFGFYNQELVNQIERIESYIADFLGKHYWTDYFTVGEGSSGNENLLTQHEVMSIPATQKYYDDQLYDLPVFKEARFLIAKLDSVFGGAANYFSAFSTLSSLKESAKVACEAADDYLIKKFADSKQLKQLIFYSERSSAAYGVFEELIRQLEVFEYSVGSTEHFEINLADIYSPGFKELSPVTLGLLQAVLPISVSSLIVGDFKFGLLYSLNQNIFTFVEADDSKGEFINPIEFQNQIRSICEVMGKINESANVKSKKDKKNDCSKTVLYQICVFASEAEKIKSDATAVTQSAVGPNPQKCRMVQIQRAMPPKNIVLANLVKMASGGRLSLDPDDALDDVTLYNYQFGAISYTNNPLKYFYESITLPSEQTYPLRLMSKTSSEVFIPFQQFIEGGLEDSSDISKILENDGFSVDISLNNITPNIRELFGDQSTPAFVLSPTSDALTADPVIMDYQGYKNDTPAYQFTTFSQFHKTLKKYYDEKAISIQGPGVSFSADLFCSSISLGLKNILSVNNGLSSLNITLGEGGLNLKCQFNSRPAKASKMETLIYKNKPNIKFKNTNFLT